jgi:hypothetical protein
MSLTINSPATAKDQFCLTPARGGQRRNRTQDNGQQSGSEHQKEDLGQQPEQRCERGDAGYNQHAAHELPLGLQ